MSGAATASFTTRPLTVVDLFCGAGGFANGVVQLARENGHDVLFRAVADIDARATEVYSANHQVQRALTQSVYQLVRYKIHGHGAEAEFTAQPRLAPTLRLGEIDLIVAGPPCQGHSNLNNFTRNTDDRNSYYLTAIAFAVAAEARAVVVENVMSVKHDSRGVVAAAAALLTQAGYRWTAGILDAAEMGWPQTRRRHFLVARREDPPISLDEIVTGLRAPPASVSCALEPLVERAAAAEPGDTLNAPARMTDVTRMRINHLFDNDIYDLPNVLRPECHRNGHTYGACYGRMHPDKPAPTITTHFTTPGTGRFIHPTQRRTITPAEAARLQGFPDDYRWQPPGPTRLRKSELCKWIGDAVPMPLGYAAALSALGPNLTAAPSE